MICEIYGVPVLQKKKKYAAEGRQKMETNNTNETAKKNK